MVVLVKCPNNSFTLAKESHLTDLINEGLVVEVLRNGMWVTAIRAQIFPESVLPVLADQIYEMGLTCRKS